MSEADEMFCSESADLHVVGRNRGTTQLFHSSIDQHDLPAVLDHLAVGLGFSRRKDRAENQTVSALQERFDLIQFAFLIFVRTANQELKAGWMRDGFYRAHNFGKVKIHQVGNDYSDEMGAVRGQRACMLIRLIVHSSRDREHALSRLWA